MELLIVPKDDCIALNVKLSFVGNASYRDIRVRVMLIFSTNSKIGNAAPPVKSLLNAPKDVIT